MHLISKISLSILLTAGSLSVAFAQRYHSAVEKWDCLFSYSGTTSIATDGEKFYCGTNTGFYIYDRLINESVPYNKANGLSDVSIVGVTYDGATDAVVIVYENSNIDIYKDKKFYNIPDILVSGVLGDKSVHHVTSKLGIAYLSTGLGLITINIKKQEIRETIPFFDGTTMGNVYGCDIVGDTIHVSTSVGIYKTNITNPLIQNYGSWIKVNDTGFQYFAVSNNHYFGVNNDTLFTIDAAQQHFPIFNSPKKIGSLNWASDGAVWLGQISAGYDDGTAYKINTSGTLLDSFRIFNSFQILEEDNGIIWAADNVNKLNQGGLKRVRSFSVSDRLAPVGPAYNSSFDIYVNNEEIWVAHGSMTTTFSPTFDFSGFSRYKDGGWYNFESQIQSIGDNYSSDIVRIYKDKFNGSMYIGSLFGGLFELKTDETFKQYKFGILEPTMSDHNSYKVAGLANDSKGNLWIGNYNSENELKVKTPEGNFYKYHIPGNNINGAADIIVDDNDYKWFISPSVGLIVFDDNGTLNNTNDDRSKIFRAGNNTIHSNNVTSIAKDKDGSIWVGTDNGVTVVYCSYDPFNSTCKAETPVVQYPGQTSAGRLFDGNFIRAIAVDAANRKWIATNNGVWLISEDAEEIIYQFDVSNSPLPSNITYRINIDEVTGDVYFSTDKGIARFRSTATEGKEKQERPLNIYPNPVPSDFNGMIAIRDLVNNADVRITDISGQLVFRTKANGGEAVWNGKDYTGKKAQSGVYLVFVVNRDGSEKATGKIIFHE